MSSHRRPRCLVVHPGAEMYGSDRVLLESVVALVERGLQVLVALPAPGPLVEELRRAGASVVFSRALVLRKDLLSPLGVVRLPFIAAAALARAIRLLRRSRPDALYVNTVTLPIWPVASRLVGVPTLLHVHEAEQNAGRMVKRVLYAPARLARTVIANSGFSRDVIGEVDASLAARTRIVYNGVAGPVETTPPAISIDGDPSLVYVGRLSPRKGPDLVVEAAALLRDRGLPVRVRLLGDVFPGYEWFAEELLDSIRRLSLGETVSLEGFLPQIWPALAESDVIVVPSRLDEPFGNTAVEGTLSARPVVVSDTSGLREATTGSTSAHLVTPGSAEAIADAVEAIVHDWPAERERAISSARDAEVRFSPARYRAEIADLIEATAR